MTQPARMPALFIGHGSPMNALQDNPLTRSWVELGRRLPRPKAILCVSAHWETKGVLITAAEKPRTIHDFYGFPQALYEMAYPAPGDPALAKDLEARLAPFRARADLDGWGLDHGAWSVLKFLYPEANVPVLQLSLDLRRSPDEHYEIGRALAPLRDEGILVLGSGNIVHNLRLFDPRNLQPLPWAVKFDAEVARRITARDHAALTDYLALGPEAALAAPEPDHFLPLLYVIATQHEDEPATVFNEMVVGSLSMTSAIVGTA
ncbi:4,5-DOPA-extradiol-dioxygenase [Phenylobacterium montanum]|uniref:4,5-DOPA dioxygenase extradiol n=1 Tax=Phenylobacterium montanum TaxID=2823693 RepID=A0A975IW17_9CAUL|nr:4,5-DOPA dioxygenase extradiol [Caulobacter sp. S6]QUD89144.1 4,5-DOPA dioxygenase extradiol [Caulobacter sp. S6]